MATLPNRIAAPVRLALIGAGTIGRVHLERIAAEDQAELVAIADPAPGAAEIAARYQVPHFTDAQAMLAEIAPDGVVVATPTEFHLAPTLATLAAGAHVLVEKPIAASNDEAAQIAAKATAVERHVLVGQHRRHYPVLSRARAILTSGEIGEIVTVHGHWTVLKEGGGYWDPEWRRRRGAGPVLTNLIHEFDTLRFLCGEITAVQAEITGRVRGWEKEDAAAIVMTFANGALGTFTLSDATPSPWTWEQAVGESPRFPPSHRNTHRITGTEGALEFPRLTIWRHDAGRGWNHPIACHPIPVETADAYARQCAHFCAVVRGDETPIVTAEDGARTLAAVLAVFEAAEAGRRIVL